MVLIQIQSPAHQEFRTRIGKDMCTLFDSLVKLDWRFYKIKDTTLSKSCGTSSKRKSSGISKQEMARIEEKVEAEKLYHELETFELDVDQIAQVMLKLSDNQTKRDYFWACQDPEIRKCYAIRLIR